MGSLTEEIPITSHYSYHRSDSHANDPVMSSASEVGSTEYTQQAEASLQDRLAAAAVSGTFEFFKQVGGLTLSTTGALVAPPLHITKTFLLPNLWAAFKDYLSTTTPNRLKDWFRIVNSSVYHVFHTLQNTEAGHAFSNRAVIVAADILECICADTTRQLLLDTMATAVKLAEMLSTPESHAFLEHGVVTACRGIDAMSNGQNKLLLHNIKHAVWNFCQLAADPATTTALAEVTAYLCYALEMEQHKQNDDIRHTSSVINQHRRQERNMYQRGTTIEKDTLVGGRTVEEVILSSLGTCSLFSDAEPDDDNDEDKDDCSSRNLCKPSRDGQHTLLRSTTPVISNHRQMSYESKSKQICDEDNARKSNNVKQEWHEQARSDVNVQLLRERVEQRAVNIQAEKHRRKQRKQQSIENDKGDTQLVSAIERTCDDLEELVETVVLPEEGDNDNADPFTYGKRRRQRAAIHSSVVEKIEVRPKDMAKVGFLSPLQSNEWNHNQPRQSHRRDGETAILHFNRVLDEILNEKRDEAVQTTIQNGGYHHNVESSWFQKKPGASRRHPTSARVVDAKSQSTVKDRLKALRTELLSRQNANEYENIPRIKAVLTKNEKTLFLLGLAVVATISLLWFSFGCYGMLVYLRPTTRRSRVVLPPPTALMPSTHHEIVIRLVRESDDSALGVIGTHSSAVDLEEVAQCVASVIK